MARKATTDYGGIQPDRKNANKGTVRGRGMVEASLRETGAGRSILLDKDGRIIAGNKTFEAATDIGLPVRIVETNGKELVAVKRTDLDLDDDTGMARKLAYYDNRASQVGLEWDAEVVLADLGAGVDLPAMFRQDELDELLADLLPKATEGDTPAEVDRAEELRQKWGTAPGQLWQLGEHRLVCGDCTDPATVARVMGGDGWDLCVTSPPYNSGNGGYTPQSGRVHRDFYIEKTDSRTAGEWVVFCDSVMTICGAFASGDDSVLCWNIAYNKNTRHAYGKQVFAGNHPFTVKETIVWDKTRGFGIATKGILSRNCELVFVLSKGSDYKTTQKENEIRWAKWTTPPPKQDDTHHATFPVDVPQNAIEYFGGAIVYEPFSGSGTTIIACENLGRKCRACEISPAYVAVALERWSVHTSRTPVLVDI